MKCPTAVHPRAHASLSPIVAVLAGAAMTSLPSVTSAQARSLTFEDRVAAQRAIEQVYWNHRLWPRGNAAPKPARAGVLTDRAIRARVAAVESQRSAAGGQVTMKAIEQDGYGSPDLLRLREIDRPAVGDDRLLVKVGAASVNAADWHLLGGLPHLIGRFLGESRSRVRGFDLAGQVEAVGRNVTRFKPGDDVFGTGVGTFAEYAATSEDRLAPMPRGLTFEQAAAIPVAGVTALQGLRDKARVQPGQSVAVYGAGGGVGTF